MKERIKALEIQVQGLTAQIQQLANHAAKEQQENRTLLEKLAAVTSLEWSKDAKAWASKDKLKALRESPRD